MSGKSSSVQIPTDFTLSHPIQRVASFDDLPISDALLRGIYGYGFEEPSAVQRVALPAVLQTERPDVVVQARSGSGKTGVFCIAALDSVTRGGGSRGTALILSPTRELAEQSGKVARGLGDSLKEVEVHVATGGHKTENLGERGVKVVISGTPGRVSQMLRDLSMAEMWNNVKLVVLDEADELLMKDQGFKEQIREIFRRIEQKNKHKIQKILVSATLPEEVIQLTNELMNDPIRILMRSDQLTVKEIQQFNYHVDSEELKFHALCDLYDRLSVTQSVVFCNTKTKVDVIYKKLLHAKFPVSDIHGDMSQKDRDSVISKFRSGSIRVLVTTDIIGRGIDVQSVSLVVCFDLPINKELYLHRIGRSGRFGRKGLAVNLVTQDDVPKIHELQKFYDILIPDLPHHKKLRLL
jgi:ATP-dependent RNA helicase